MGQVKEDQLLLVEDFCIGNDDAVLFGQSVCVVDNLANASGRGGSSGRGLRIGVTAFGTDRLGFGKLPPFDVIKCGDDGFAFVLCIIFLRLVGPRFSRVNTKQAEHGLLPHVRLTHLNAKVAERHVG